MLGLAFERLEHLHKQLSLCFERYKQLGKRVGLLVRNFSRRDLRDRVHRSNSIAVVVIEGNIFNKE